MLASQHFPSYTRLRLRDPDGSIREVRLPRPLSPADACNLARAAREAGLRVAILTDPVPHTPPRNTTPRLTLGPTAPMSREQRRRASLIECEPHKDELARLREALSRLVRQHGRDVVESILRERG